MFWIGRAIFRMGMGDSAQGVMLHIPSRAVSPHLGPLWGPFRLIGASPVEGAPTHPRIIWVRVSTPSTGGGTADCKNPA